MKRLLSAFILQFILINLSAQMVWVPVPPDSVEPDASWETGYLQRREWILTSNGWTSRSNRGDTDNGKRYWPLLLGEMYLKRNNQASIDSLIIDASRGGHSGIYGTYEGSFYKAFSCPGYAFYYFTYYDRITAVDNVQHSRVQQMWNNPNRGYTCRTDGKMDPIYTCSEFNSENFDWMARIGGYLMAHHFNDNTIIPDGNLPAQQYFQNWVNNWVRATYCAGRVEWNSHVYFVYCFQAAAALAQFAEDSMTRLRGRAVMDWMAMELALHYLDGHQVGPESRNKNGGYKVYDNDVLGYEYLWFADDSNKVTTVPDDSVRKWYSKDLHTSGFIGLLNYRPPQVIIDIAQRKFNTPVEMHNVKPFYRLDYENYKHWKGTNNTNGKRFEYETAYLHKNYSLISLAAGRPKGVDCFWEECVWRLGVKGLQYQVFGNSGSITNIGGRCEYEQIGQYRNTMIRVIKGTNNMWVAIPDEVTNKGFDGNILFANLGNGVYMAVRPYNSTGTSSADFKPAAMDDYTKYTWNFSSTALGALVLEVGTAEEHSSYTNFKTQVKACALTSPASNQVQYVSTLGRTLKVEHTGTTSYSYTLNSCGTSVINPAGKYPRVWYDDVETNFNTWNSYQVVYGDTIVDDKWGDGTLYLKSNHNQLKIIVDTSNAHVRWEVLRNITALPQQETRLANSFTIHPNPAQSHAVAKITLNQQQRVSIYLNHLSGQSIGTLYTGILTPGVHSVPINLNGFNAGLYLVTLEAGGYRKTVKLSITGE